MKLFFFAVKRTLRSPFCLLLLLLSVLLPPALARLGSREELPPAGYCTDGAGAADAASAALAALLDGFGFLAFDNPAALREAVQDGRLDCGFILPAGLQPLLDERQTEGALTLLVPEDAVAAPLYREQADAALFSLYAPYLTADALQGSGLSEAEVLEAFRSRMAGGALVTLSLETAEGSAAPAGLRARRYGMSFLGLLLWLAAFFGMAEPLERDRRRMAERLSPARIRQTLVLPGLAAALLLLALAGTLSLLLLRQAAQLPALLLWLACLLAALWLKIRLLPGRLPALLTALLASLSLILCPVFTDLSLLLPEVAKLRLLLPLAWFLRLAS